MTTHYKEYSKKWNVTHLTGGWVFAAALGTHCRAADHAQKRRGKPRLQRGAH
ncbi:MAG: hypothetical protein ABSF85_13950 [Terriglobales bacterium]